MVKSTPVTPWPRTFLQNHWTFKFAFIKWMCHLECNHRLKSSGVIWASQIAKLWLDWIIFCQSWQSFSKCERSALCWMVLILSRGKRCWCKSMRLSLKVSRLDVASGCIGRSSSRWGSLRSVSIRSGRLARLYSERAVTLGMTYVKVGRLHRSYIHHMSVVRCSPLDCDSRRCNATWVYCRTIECSIKWPELDWYWVGRHEDLVPLCSSRYDQQHIPL